MIIEQAIVQSLVSLGPSELSVIGMCHDYRGSDCTKFGILGPSELSLIGRCRDYRGSDCMMFGIFRTK